MYMKTWKFKMRKPGERAVTYTITSELREKQRPVKHWETLEETEKPLVLSFMGESRRRLGQIGDHLEEILKDGWYCENCNALKKILRLWKRWHLNDMMPGTKRQMQALKRAGLDQVDYEKQVTYLKWIDLYNDRGFEYGSGWLYEPLPEDIKQQIDSIPSPDESPDKRKYRGEWRGLWRKFYTRLKRLAESMGATRRDYDFMLDFNRKKKVWFPRVRVRNGSTLAERLEDFKDWAQLIWDDIHKEMPDPLTRYMHYYPNEKAITGGVSEKLTVDVGYPDLTEKKRNLSKDLVTW